MDAINSRFSRIGLKIPEVLLPSGNIDMKKWAVIACDQYSSEREYWEGVEKYTAGSPSTLNLIYPECYLDEEEPEKRIKKIHETMASYLKGGVLSPSGAGFILVKRDNKIPRYGLMALLDLEDYDYTRNSKSKIRATEGTILDRIPPRVRIREKACLDLPHIMVLIDDPLDSVIGSLKENIPEFEKIYDFDLMKGGGRISGYLINSSDSLSKIASGMEKLGDVEEFDRKYGSRDPLLYAMGDGNHSLAAAKSVWEKVKKKGDMNHSARWALAEIVNIYDKGIVFEPIHRVLFGLNPDLFLKELASKGFRIEYLEDSEKIISALAIEDDKHRAGFISGDKKGLITKENPKLAIASATIQDFLDGFLKINMKIGIDYIHGLDASIRLGSEKGNFSLLLPPIKKSDFFRTLTTDGVFPRKTFSIGAAHEKRYYLEAREIRRGGSSG